MPPLRSPQTHSQSAKTATMTSDSDRIPAGSRGDVMEFSLDEIDDMKQTCPFCSANMNLSDLFVHVKDCHRAYICVYCQDNFRFPKELMVHLHRRHRIPSQKFMTATEYLTKVGVNSTFLCVDCDRLFEPLSAGDFIGFMSHKCQRKTGTCPKCGSMFLLSLLGDHVASCKDIRIPKNATTAKHQENNSNSGTSNMSPYALSDPKCKFCQHSFRHEKIEEHRRSCVMKPRTKASPKPQISSAQSQKAQLVVNNEASQKLNENLTTESEVLLTNQIFSEQEEKIEIKITAKETAPEVLTEKQVSPLQEKKSVHRPVSQVEKSDAISMSAARSLAERQARQILGKEVSVTLEPASMGLKDRRSHGNSCRRCGDKVTASTLATHMRSCLGRPSPITFPQGNNKSITVIDLKKRATTTRRDSKDQEVVVLLKNTKIPVRTIQSVMNPPNTSKIRKAVKPPAQVIPPPPPLDPLLTEPDAGARLLMLLHGLTKKLEKDRKELLDPADINKYTLVFINLFSQLSDTRILNEMIQKSRRNCNYCRQVTLIRVDKRQLVVHLLYQHDWEVWSGQKPPTPVTAIDVVSLSSKSTSNEPEALGGKPDTNVIVKDEKPEPQVILNVDEGENTASLTNLSSSGVLNKSALSKIMNESYPTKIEKSDNSDPVLETEDSVGNNESILKINKEINHSTIENRTLEDDKVEEIKPEVVEKPSPVARDDFKSTILKKVFESENIIFSFEPEVKKEFGEIPCECLLCGFSADSQKNLFTHWRKVHPGVAYKCVMCQGPFLYAGSLFSHLCTGSPQPFLDAAAAAALSPGGSVTATYTDTVFLKYQCGICDDLKLPGFFNYMVHLRKDHNKCELCLQTLSDQKQLEKHMKKHQLNYFCWKCDKDYCIVLNYEQHLLWKHGTESETCSRCLKKRWPHIYHFCIPPDSFKCDVCMLVFTRARALRVHSRLHSGDNLKKCPSCPSKFVSNKLVKKHLQEAHITKIICDTLAVGDYSAKMKNEVDPEVFAVKEEVPLKDEGTVKVEEEIKPEEVGKEKSESRIDIPNAPTEPESKDTTMVEPTSDPKGIGSNFSLPIPISVGDEAKIDETKEANVIDKVNDQLTESLLDRSGSEKPKDSESVAETDVAGEQTQHSANNEGKVDTAEKSRTVVPNPSSPRQPDHKNVLNGNEIEDVFDKLINSMPLSPSDDSKKPFSLSEVQGPNLSEDESGPDSDDESKSEKDGQTPLLSMPPISQTSPTNVEMKDKLNEESSTTRIDESLFKDVNSTNNINEAEDPSALPPPPKMDNSIPGIDEGMLDLAVANSLKNGDDILSLTLDSSSGAEGEQKQQDDFGSMSPLLPPLDDFNFNVPEIPSFEDDTLPEHIIRENALFALRFEHDYAIATVPRNIESNLLLKRKAPGDAIDGNILLAKTTKKLKVRKPILLKEKKNSAGGKKKRRHSSCSSSSSSSSTCGSNCSCSDSSCSSSANSSDSSCSDSQESPDGKAPAHKKRRHGVESSKKKNKHKKAEKKKKRPLVKQVKIKVQKEPKPAKAKKLPKPKPPKKCTKSSKNHNITANANIARELNDILRHFKNPEDAYILESDLDTDESGSDEAFHKKQLTEIIGKAPEFLEEIWNLGNETFLLRMVRGVSRLEELRPKPRANENDVYSLKRSENAIAPRLKVRNVPIKPLIVQRVPEGNGPVPVNKKVAKSPITEKGQLQTSLNLTSTSNTKMISRGSPNAATSDPALTFVKPRSVPKTASQKKLAAPIVPSTEEAFPICKIAAAASVTKIAGTEMTLECINRLTDEIGSGAGDRPILSSSSPVPKRAKMKITGHPTTKSKSTGQSTTKSQNTGQSTTKNKKAVQQQHQKDLTLYCICQSPHDYVSQMIGCDARDCPYQWFHFECVGILIAPKGKWYCPDCLDKRIKKSQMLRQAKGDSGVAQPTTASNQLDENVKGFGPNKS